MKNSRASVPTVCIVGRPNVGKSSLFNRLLGQRRAVVVEQSGTTRDRVEAIARIGHMSVKLVDTGGYLADDPDALSPEVKEQIFGAVEDSSIILMVTDAISGLHPADKEVSDILHRSSKTVIPVANKADNDDLQNDALEFYQLGLGHPETVSCQHGKGVESLRKRILENIKELPAVKGEQEKRALKIAVVGRPNVGKSSFVNNLLDRKRVIVSDIPGTTRDSIDTFFTYEDEDYIFIDTAGIRHSRKIRTAVDTYSVMRSKESIQRADVVVLLLDAAEGVTRDDMGILDLIEENGKACLLLVNKWDLASGAEDVTAEDYEKHLIYASERLSKMPVFFVSAMTGENIIKTLSMIKVLDSNLDLEISTPYLNRIFEKNDPSKVPISRARKRPNFLYLVQSSRRPVEFKYFVNDPSAVIPAHVSYIENQLRRNLPLKGIPVKIHFVRSRKRG